eukprot:CAMPEP_0172662358 /NCGR_PEP_ID=MMETSP1074-20121228/5315_1 /TAXON_ID=2916 /ORGANISM="Ceratium fusus, Strain PA161109" /LENGTH=63 /DNA_ID=CAMNT_0013478263 /DNA_START=11 /DNA_END=198 /DNA_ORIENTATION=+
MGASGSTVKKAGREGEAAPKIGAKDSGKQALLTSKPEGGAPDASKALNVHTQKGQIKGRVWSL